MFGLELRTFDQEAAGKNPAALPFISSYKNLRMAIGLLGITLPVFLVAVDWFFVDARRPIRGSMSAYYHSSARDLFVGGLIATGLFLLSYMWAKRNTYDYWLSSAAGVLVIIVAFFPTGREGTEIGKKGFAVGPDSCADFAGPPLCSGIQERLGEDAVRTIHQLSAVAFVVLLAILCLVFALREFGYGRAAQRLLAGGALGVAAVRAALKARGVGVLRYLWSGLPASDEPGVEGAAEPPPRRRVITYLGAAGIILLSGAWAKLGGDLSLWFVDGPIGATYVGEFGAFVSFGLAWMVAAWDLVPAPLTNLGELAARTIDKLSGAEATLTSQ